MAINLLNEGSKGPADPTLVEHFPDRKVKSQRVTVRQLNAPHPLAEYEQRVRHLERDETPACFFSLVSSIGSSGAVKYAIGRGLEVGSHDPPVVGDEVAVRVCFQDQRVARVVEGGGAHVREREACEGFEVLLQDRVSEDL